MMRPLDSFQISTLIAQVEQVFTVMARIESQLVRIESKIEHLERINLNIIQNQGSVGQAGAGDNVEQSKSSV